MIQSSVGCSDLFLFFTLKKYYSDYYDVFIHTMTLKDRLFKDTLYHSLKVVEIHSLLVTHHKRRERRKSDSDRYYILYNKLSQRVKEIDLSHIHGLELANQLVDIHFYIRGRLQIKCSEEIYYSTQPLYFSTQPLYEKAISLGSPIALYMSYIEQYKGIDTIEGKLQFFYLLDWNLFKEDKEMNLYSMIEHGCDSYSYTKTIPVKKVNKNGFVTSIIWGLVKDMPLLASSSMREKKKEQMVQLRELFPLKYYGISFECFILNRLDFRYCTVTRGVNAHKQVKEYFSSTRDTKSQSKGRSLSKCT